MNCIARSSGTLTMLFSSKYCSLVTAVQEHIHLVVLKKKKYIVYINMSYDTLKKHGLSAHKYRTPHGARVSIQIRMPYQNIPHFQLTILVIWSLWIFWTRTSNDQTTIQLELFYIYILSCSMKWKCVQSIHIAIYMYQLHYQIHKVQLQLVNSLHTLVAYHWFTQLSGTRMPSVVVESTTRAYD